MSISKWSKRWLYDSAAKVPKTTRWRRKLEYGSRVQKDPNAQIVDVQEEFSSEVIDDLRNNTSPLKRKKLLDDCLRDDNKEDQLTCNDNFQTCTRVPCLYDTPMATRNSDHESREDDHRKLVDCQGE